MVNRRKKGSLAHLLTKELLIEENKTLSWRQIAKKYNCSSNQITTLRKQYDMEIQSRALEDDSLKLRPKSELRIVGIKLDLSFTKKEESDLKELWKAGIHFTDIVAKMKRHYLEILYFLTEMLDQNELKPRKNGVIGEV